MDRALDHPGLTPFVQDAPRPRNGYTQDWLLRSFLRRKLPSELLAALEPRILELAQLSAGPLWDAQLEDRSNEPRLLHWDAWGNRIDRVEVTAVWREAEKLAVRYGLVAIPYERTYGEWGRVCQFALVHLMHPVTDVYTCPLAMSDGAARTLQVSGNDLLAARALPQLTSRDPAQFWTSGQWMTESTGGSDVGASQTIARRRADGRWQLYGKKWFTSAASSQMALTLARPAGNGPGGSGLAMFYLETRDASGRLNGIRIERLKDKLGTRKVPTAELTLDGTVADLVTTAANGTRAIEPMLRVTRAWNSVCASSFMRHGLGLARDYADRRRAFGAVLAQQPLHQDTLEQVDAESAAAFMLTFYLLELMGRDETGAASAADAALLRILLPIVKATTGKQAAAVMSEIIEAFGGAGYVEDTGIPTLLRDAQVLPIWEGTTNVLSLDLLLRTDLEAGLDALRESANKACSHAGDAALRRAADTARAAMDHARRWRAATRDAAAQQAGARRFALTLGRAFALALLVEHTAFVTDPADRAAARAACLRFRYSSIDLIIDDEARSGQPG
jgi:alkylation response protein AidB-like acyl-CoA dehydrogenase